MIEDIELPHLPECLLNLPLETLHDIQSHTYHAIKADRQQRGEPVAWVTEDVAVGQKLNGKDRRIWWENNEGIGTPIYTTPPSPKDDK